MNEYGSNSITIGSIFASVKLSLKSVFKSEIQVVRR